MQMKTKALFACSVTIVILLGVVGIASAAPPISGDNCDCGCIHSNPPFCHGDVKDFDPQSRGAAARGAAASFVSCVRNIPYSCLTAA